MNVEFLPSEEQAMLRDSVRRWAEQASAASEGHAHWPVFAEMGWLMAALPEEAGGLGGSAYDAAIIAEELGRQLIKAPFVEVAVVAAQLLLAIGDDRVAQIADGSLKAIVAHDEPQAGGDPEWVTTRAEESDGGWRLTGCKTGVVGAPEADILLVSARTSDGAVRLFEIAPADAQLLPFTMIDGRGAAELRLDDSPARALGTAEQALPALLSAFDHALVLESAEALGAMERALELTRDYLLTRRQYGKLIGDFQVLRHRLADMFIEVEQARSMVLRGLAALSAAAPERAAMAAATKARTAQAGMFVGAQAIQLHGGIGVTDEYPVGHLFKRLLAFDTRHGTRAAQVGRFAALTRRDR